MTFNSSLAADDASVKEHSKHDQEKIEVIANKYLQCYALKPDDKKMCISKLAKQNPSTSSLNLDASTNSYTYEMER